MAAVLFRIIILLVVPAAFSFAFLVAFAKLYDPDHQQINGVILGVVAAIAWGLSVFGTTGWTGVFNFFAALLTVIALGYATPVTPICDKGSATVQQPATTTSAIAETTAVALCRYARWLGASF